MEAPSSNMDIKNVNTASGHKYHPCGKLLYVFNLPSSMLFTFDNTLKEIFSKYGDITKISIKIMSHRIVSMGCGNISRDGAKMSAQIYYDETISSEKALAEDGRIIDGNSITLEILRAGPSSIKVDNLPMVVKKECLMKLFQPCGNVINVIQMEQCCTAFVDFEDRDGMNRALSLRGQITVNDKIINIARHGPSVKKVNKKEKYKNKNNIY